MQTGNHTQCHAKILNMKKLIITPKTTPTFYSLPTSNGTTNTKETHNQQPKLFERNLSYMKYVPNDNDEPDMKPLMMISSLYMNCKAYHLISWILSI